MVPKMLEMLAVKKKKYDEEAAKRKRKQEETRARNKRNREKKVRYMTKPPGRGGVGRSFPGARARACVFSFFLGCGLIVMTYLKGREMFIDSSLCALYGN